MSGSTSILLFLSCRQQPESGVQGILPTIIQCLHDAKLKVSTILRQHVNTCSESFAACWVQESSSMTLPPYLFFKILVFEVLWSFSSCKAFCSDSRQLSLNTFPGLILALQLCVTCSFSCTQQNVRLPHSVLKVAWLKSSVKATNDCPWHQVKSRRRVCLYRQGLVKKFRHLRRAAKKGKSPQHFCAKIPVVQAV